MNVDAYAVSERVGEIFIQAELCKIVAGERVRRFAANSVRHAFLYEIVSRQYPFVSSFELAVLFIVAEEKRPRAVRAVTARFTAEVD